MSADQFSGADARPPSKAGAWKHVAIYGLLTLIALFPVLSVEIPGLEDYPNHLARIYILSHYQTSEALRRFYDVHWRPIPYLGMDASLMVLLKIANIYNAGRIFVGACILMPVASVAALHFVTCRRASLVPTAAFLLGYNFILRWGFLNYLPILCLAVLVFAGWVATVDSPRWPRLLVFSVLALILYFGHLVAFGAYCLMVATFEIFRTRYRWTWDWRRVAADWAYAALQAVPAAIVLASTKVDRPFVGPLYTAYGQPSEKLMAILSPVLFTLSTTEVVIALVSVLVLVFAGLTGRVRFTPPVFWIFAVVGLLAVCVPSRLLDVFGMDFRLPLLAAMLLVAAVETTERADALFRRGAVVFIILMSALHSWEVASALRAVDQELAILRGVLAEMPVGMRLLTVDVSDDRRNTADQKMAATRHAPLLAVIDREAFVPTLFTGLSTVEPSRAMRASATPNGAPYPDLAQLVAGYQKLDDPNSDIPSGFGGRVYWLGWERKFDYVLVLHYGRRPNALPGHLRLVDSSEVADLYEISGR